MSNIELKWLMNDSDEDKEPDLLTEYYQEIASGPMTSYRRIIQGGNKQGQNYYAHVLDGIALLHKLRVARVIELNDLEEQLLFAAYTIHDINKIEPYGGRDKKLSYTNIATLENIGTELRRLDFRRFFYEWEEYLEDIKLLAHLHQHNAAPVFDLNRSHHNYKIPYERLLELGQLMYAADNLDLSHTLAENNHKQGFVAIINALSERRWRWVRHQLGENRGLLSNIIHNEVVTYLRKRHTHDDHTTIIDLLYYPEGVAYLLPEREEFSWSIIDTEKVAQHVAQAVSTKKGSSFDRFIKSKPAGIKVAKTAIESGASYTDIMYVISKNIERKRYLEKQHNERNQKIRTALENVASIPSIADFVQQLLSSSEPIIPLEQALLRRGELASAYRNLLQDHLKKELKKVFKRDPWSHIYALFGLPSDHYALYTQINDYQRGYFIARECPEDFDTLFDRLLADVVTLTGEQIATPPESKAFRDYLATNLEVSSISSVRGFKAHLQHYIKDNHKQCCNCSSPLRSVKLMEAEVPDSIGVQAFSNRLTGGGGEPKRNVCEICRTQFILEKLAWTFFNRRSKSKTKNGEKLNSEFYTSFYLHLYPYSFFTAPHLDAMYETLKNVCHEDNRCLFLHTNRYFQQWGEQLERNLASQIAKQAKQITGEASSEFTCRPTKVNGVSVPNFGDAIGNIPILPINAPGENYGQQFIFALTHALMIADFFSCRVVMSRTPVPLLTNEYMTEHALAFFIDGVPINLRWLLPTGEYRSIETYRDKEMQGGDVEYNKRREHWGSEQPDEQGYAAYENISKRLATMYQLTQKLNLSGDSGEDLLLDIARAATDDPLSVYHVVDLAIEKKIRETSNNKRKSGKEAPSENLAIHLSRHVAPLLAGIVKE